MNSMGRSFVSFTGPMPRRTGWKGPVAVAGAFVVSAVATAAIVTGGLPDAETLPIGIPGAAQAGEVAGSAPLSQTASGDPAPFTLVGADTGSDKAARRGEKSGAQKGSGRGGKGAPSSEVKNPASSEEPQTADDPEVPDGPDTPSVPDSPEDPNPSDNPDETPNVPNNPQTPTNPVPDAPNNIVSGLVDPAVTNLADQVDSLIPEVTTPVTGEIETVTDTATDALDAVVGGLPVGPLLP